MPTRHVLAAAVVSASAVSFLAGLTGCDQLNRPMPSPGSSSSSSSSSSSGSAIADAGEQGEGGRIVPTFAPQPGDIQL